MVIDVLMPDGITPRSHNCAEQHNSSNVRIANVCVALRVFRNSLTTHVTQTTEQTHRVATITTRMTGLEIWEKFNDRPLRLKKGLAL